MTPVEKIIVKNYCCNTFMFNPEEDYYYLFHAKQKFFLSVQQAIFLELNVELSSMYKFH